MKSLYLMEIFDKNITGFTTYKHEFLNSMQGNPNVLLNVITLGYPCSELLQTKETDIFYHRIPSIKGQPKEVIAKIMKSFIVDDNHAAFFINYNPSYPTVKMLKEYFPQSRIVVVIHDLMWASFTYGDVNRFKKILNQEMKKGMDEILANIYEEGQKSYLLADKVVCLSNDTYELLRNLYKIPTSKLIIIQNGLREFQHSLSQNFGQAHNFDQKKILLYVGRGSYQKGFFTLVNAYYSVINAITNCKLVVAGEIDCNIDMDYIQKDKILLLGQISKQDLYEWYNIADVGIIPSYYEQCSYVGIEMKKFGLPVIASDGFGVRDMFDKTNSIIAHIGNRNTPCEYQNNLAKCIIKFLKMSNAAIDSLRKKSTESFYNRYQAKDMGKKYLNLLENLY